MTRLLWHWGEKKKRAFTLTALVGRCFSKFGIWIDVNAAFLLAGSRLNERTYEEFDLRQFKVEREEKVPLADERLQTQDKDDLKTVEAWQHWPKLQILASTNRWLADRLLGDFTLILKITASFPLFHIWAVGFGCSYGSTMQTLFKTVKNESPIQLFWGS